MAPVHTETPHRAGALYPPPAPCSLYHKSLAALPPSGLQDPSARSSAHACEEPMYLLTSPLSRLPSSLGHYSYLSLAHKYGLLYYPLLHTVKCPLAEAQSLRLGH